MGEPAPVPPSMRKADGWPLSAVETILVGCLTYLMLLISLAAARPHRPGPPDLPDPPARLPVVAALVGAPRPVAVVQRSALAACVTARTVPESYATSPDARQRGAFGPPAVPTGGTGARGSLGPLGLAKVNGELWHRLCGGVGAAGGRPHAPDRRLYVAIDAAVNRRDPNRIISRAEWAAGVVRFIAHDALWDRARLVTRTAPRGTATFAMRVRPGADPLVLRTRLVAPNRSIYLLLPVRSASGWIVPITLRLSCGFQPTFLPASGRASGNSGN
jgi:hypothetical protein